jgi:excisionase family DNA binding protein
MLCAERLLTPVQVAEILGIKLETLAAWRCTGRYNLPYVKSGRLVRYREDDIQAFIKRRLREFATPCSCAGASGK